MESGLPLARRRTALGQVPPGPASEGLGFDVDFPAPTPLSGLQERDKSPIRATILYGSIPITLLQWPRHEPLQGHPIPDEGVDPHLRGIRAWADGAAEAGASGNWHVSGDRGHVNHFEDLFPLTLDYPQDSWSDICQPRSRCSV